MLANAVIFQEPERLTFSSLALDSPTHSDVIVDIDHSGISSGTERLLYLGKMPPFPGLAYPLVPGYESVGRISKAAANGNLREGDRVFVPGARCYGEVNALFGGTASRIVASEASVIPLSDTLGREASLLALAATAHHALSGRHATPPDLVVGHGVLGRILARLSIALGNKAPVVWELSEARMSGATGYRVAHPEDDRHTNYASIYDASGDPHILDTLIGSLSKGGEITLAGFYAERLGFAFPAAFMREARFRVAAEWKPEDMAAVSQFVDSGKLSLDGLITHTASAADAADAYQTAFKDADCLHMVLDWKGAA